MRTQLVDSLLVDLLQNVRFLPVYMFKCNLSERKTHFVDAQWDDGISELLKKDKQFRVLTVD